MGQNKNTGTVKFFNVTKGYGFVKQNETDKEYFFHATNLLDEVKTDDEVMFDLIDGRKGLQATNVQLLK